MPRGRLRGSLILAVIAGLALASCAGNPNVGQSGAASGTTTGGIAGASSPAGAVVGGVAGGILGGTIGATLDDRDRQRAYAAEMEALEFGEPGAPVGWRGDAGGRRGTVVPGAYYEARGTRCRDISHTIYVDGRPQISRGTACRTTDGTWAPPG
jgi:surface antigen